MLLVTFETPGVVFDLWHHIAFFQAKVKYLCLLLHLITIITAEQRTKKDISFSATELHNNTRLQHDLFPWNSKGALLPHNLVFFTTVSTSVFAIVVILRAQRGLLFVAPLHHLALGLTVCWGVFVFQVPWFAVEGVGDEAQIPFLILFKTDWNYTWESEWEREREIGEVLSSCLLLLQILTIWKSNCTKKTIWSTMSKRDRKCNTVVVKAW